MRNWTGIVAAALLVMLSIGPARSAKFNFELLYHVAQLADQAYEGKSEVLGRLSNKTAQAYTPGKSQVQYVLNFNHARKIQVVSVRGTANRVNKRLDLDITGVPDRKSGIVMHRGFRRAALGIYAHLKPRLKPGYTTYLTGHSLGGAIAAILGIYLSIDGEKLGMVVTFGQPKFTNVAGARAYANLRLLRVIYQNDTVPFLPERVRGSRQFYAHMGAVLNLLSGPYYLSADRLQARRFSKGSFRKMIGLISVPDHSMKWYLKGLKEKIGNSVEVGFKERNKYIVRHKRGSYAGQKVRRKNNFNRHR